MVSGSVGRDFGSDAGYPPRRPPRVHSRGLAPNVPRRRSQLSPIAASIDAKGSHFDVVANRTFEPRSWLCRTNCWCTAGGLEYEKRHQREAWGSKISARKLSSKLIVASYLAAIAVATIGGGICLRLGYLQGLGWFPV